MYVPGTQNLKLVLEGTQRSRLNPGRTQVFCPIIELRKDQRHVPAMTIMGMKPVISSLFLEPSLAGGAHDDCAHTCSFRYLVTALHPIQFDGVSLLRYRNAHTLRFRYLR